MGSHFSQCFATQQTIAPGDRCYALALRQQHTYSPVEIVVNGKGLTRHGISFGALWPDAYWTPVGNFIAGTYKLNGDIDIDCTNENARRLLAFVRVMLANAAVTKVGDNTTHELAYDLPQFVAESCPVLSAYIKEASVCALSPEEGVALMPDLARVWRLTDEVAVKHRVFFVDHSGEPVPLQFTLLHRAAYERLLEVKDAVDIPAEMFADALLATKELRTEIALNPDSLNSRLFSKFLAQQFFDKVSRTGAFHSIRYFENELGLPDILLRHAQGELTDAALYKRVIHVFQDRFVVARMDAYQLKFKPKSIGYEDRKNRFGMSYSELVASVRKEVCQARGRLDR